MKVIITLGNAHAPHHADLPFTVTKILPDQLAEISPDYIFDAMQRIGDMNYDGITVITPAEHQIADIDRIMARHEDRVTGMWLAILRVELDYAGAPSMSTGDTIKMVSDSGRLIVTHVCESVGWTSTRPTEPVVTSYDADTWADYNDYRQSNADHHAMLEDLDHCGHDD